MHLRLRTRKASTLTMVYAQLVITGWEYVLQRDTQSGRAWRLLGAKHTGGRERNRSTSRGLWRSKRTVACTLWPVLPHLMIFHEIYWFLWKFTDLLSFVKISWFLDAMTKSSAYKMLIHLMLWYNTHTSRISHLPIAVLLGDILTVALWPARVPTVAHLQVQWKELHSDIKNFFLVSIKFKLFCISL